MKTRNFFCLAVLLAAGCDSKKDVVQDLSTSPKVESVTSNAPQNKTYNITFRVTQGPPDSLITYTYGKKTESLNSGAPWEKTVQAQGGDYVSVYCSPAAKTIGTNVPVAVELLVDGQVSQQKSTNGRMADVSIKALPLPDGYTLPTPSNEELQKQIADLQSQQSDAEDDRRRDDKKREDQAYEADQASREKQYDIRSKQKDLQELEDKKSSLERSKLTNQAPDVVQREIDGVDREIRDTKREIVNLGTN